MGLDVMMEKFQARGVVFDEAEFVARFDFDRIEKMLRTSRVEISAGVDGEHLRDFQQPCAAGAYHFLQDGGIRGIPQFVVDDMMDHGAIMESRNSVFPIQRAFFQCVDVCDGKNSSEPGHAGENGRTLVHGEIAKLNRPRIHENHLDIEDNEQHRDHVKFHGEARCSIANRQHTAFVGGILDGIATGRATEDHTEDEGGDGKTAGNDDLKQNWKIILGHGGEC
jgi:hypothetical protein